MRAILSLTLLLATPAAAQQVAPPAEPSSYARAIAAGYKAAMLCSGIFNARESGIRRTASSIEVNELKGIYPEYVDLIESQHAIVDEQKDAVLVTYDRDAAPRIAQAQTAGGCTVLPIGTPPQLIKRRMRVNLGPFARATWRPQDEPSGKVRGVVAKPVGGAFGGTYGAATNTTAILILRDGKTVAERYAPGFTTRTPQRTWSVAKSMAGTLAGIAVALRRIDPGKPANISEWQTPGDPRQAITIDNLLRMASGLHTATAGNRTDAVYFGGTAVTEETVAWPLEVAPGSRFRYSNSDILLATRAIAASLGGEDLAPGVLLFGRLGMSDTYAERDWRGDYILSSQVWSTARDLARLGQFWLQDGVWQGKRLLPEGWMRYMTTPSGPQPASGPGYGATLWLFGPKQGLPQGSYAAQGNRGQYVMVIPSHRLVIVRRGEDPGAARFDIARFAADVAAALP